MEIMVEFKNYNIEEFVNNMRLKIEFSQVFTPWLNGINERNYYSANVVVKKIMDEDAKIKLQDAINMAMIFPGIS